MPREIAQELVEAGGQGAFVVRESQSAPGNYALTLKSAEKIVNFIIRAHKVGRDAGLKLDCCPIPSSSRPTDPIFLLSQGKFLLGDEREGERPYDTLGELILAHAEYVGVPGFIICLQESPDSPLTRTAFHLRSPVHHCFFFSFSPIQGEGCAADHAVARGNGYGFRPTGAPWLEPGAPGRRCRLIR